MCALRPPSLPLERRGHSLLPSRAKYGFTLLEVLLVLALMVVVSMLAGVNLRSGFRQQRLRKAGDQVRTEWARARVEAIKTGRVQVFYHALQGNRLLVMPQVSLDDPMASISSISNQNSMQPLGFTAPAPSWQDQNLHTIRQRQLPDGILFLGADVQLDQRSAIQLNQAVDPQSFLQFDRSFEGESLASEQWGMPIYFFPDGTSSTAELVLMNDRQETVRVYLRGLTGLVRVGQIERIDDLAGRGSRP